MFVYVLKSQDLYKIGIAKDVRDRIAQLRIGNPFGIKLVYQFETARPDAVEQSLHRRYKGKHVSGEWFALNRSDVAHLRSLVPQVITDCEAIGSLWHSLTSSKHSTKPIINGFRHGESEAIAS